MHQTSPHNYPNKLSLFYYKKNKKFNINVSNNKNTVNYNNNISKEKIKFKDKNNYKK
jgi:hypothetical protein